MVGLVSEPIMVETTPNDDAEAVVLVVVPGEGDAILLEEVELTLTRQRRY
jgi:hypothetical protein